MTHARFAFFLALAGALGLWGWRSLRTDYTQHSQGALGENQPKAERTQLRVDALGASRVVMEGAVACIPDVTSARIDAKPALVSGTERIFISDTTVNKESDRLPSAIYSRIECGNLL